MRPLAKSALEDRATVQKPLQGGAGLGPEEKCILDHWGFQTTEQRTLLQIVELIRSKKSFSEHGLVFKNTTRGKHFIHPL